MSERYVYLNGRVVPGDEAAVSPSDAGFLHGASVFTTMLARNGKTFRLDRHLDRLMVTVRDLGMRHEASRELLTAAVGELLQANGLSDARLRITLTPGGVRDPQGPPTTLITADPLPEYPREWYEKGVTVVVSDFLQQSGSPTDGRKTGCYFPRMVAMQAAAAKGAAEALWFTQDKRLAEACFCNIFLVSGSQLFTPPTDTPVLPGIVREAVVELAKALGIECHTERPLAARDLLDTDEAFLTASCSGIRPVVRLERREIGCGEVGDLTRGIMAAYRDLLARECGA